MKLNEITEFPTNIDEDILTELKFPDESGFDKKLEDIKLSVKNLNKTKMFTDKLKQTMSKYGEIKSLSVSGPSISSSYVFRTVVKILVKTKNEISGLSDPVLENMEKDVVRISGNLKVVDIMKLKSGDLAGIQVDIR